MFRLNIGTSLYFIASIFYFFLSFFFMSFLKMKRDARWVLVAMLLSLMVASFAGIAIHSSSDFSVSETWFKYTYFLIYLMPGFILHFVFSLSGSEIPKPLYVFVYFPGIVLSIAHFMDVNLAFGGFINEGGFRKIVYLRKSFLPTVYIPYLYLYLALALNVLFDWGKKTKIYRDKRISKILIVMGMVSFMLTGGLAVYEFSERFESSGFFMGLMPVSMLFWFIAIWYSVLRFKFSDITSADAAEAILEKVRDIILLVDQDGFIITANGRFYEILGYSEDEVIGKNFEEFIDDCEKITHRFRRKSDKKRINDEYVFEVNYRAKSGELVPVKIAISIVVDKLKEMVGIVVVGQDMRIRKMLESEVEYKQKTEKELRDSYKKLKEVDKMKTDFISMISHELRTPLTSILGFAKIVRKKSNNLSKKENLKTKEVESVASILENISIIIEEGERLGNLINDVLDIAKMDAGKHEWKFKEINIRDLVNRAFDVTSTIIEEKKLKIIKDVEDKLPPIEGDFDRLLQVMINIISNAVKFTDEGHIKCSAKKDEQSIIICISDTGIGMDKEDFKTIFDKFKQVGDTLTSRPKGTGLGLPICKQIVEHHSGEIWAQSKIDNGSEFCFRLPLKKDLLSIKKLQLESFEDILNESLEKESQNKKTVFILDNDAESVGRISNLLEAENYIIVKENSGLDIIRKIRDIKPQIILLDVQLPDANGFDIISDIKKNVDVASIPIIILSGLEDLAKGFLVGADRYLNKPVDTDELLRDMKYLINKNINNENVLIVTKDEVVINKLTDILRKKGFRAIYVSNKDEFEQKVEHYKPKLIIVTENYVAQKEILEINALREMDSTKILSLEDREGGAAHGEV